MTRYVIRAGCPNCGEEVEHAEETDAPVALDRSVTITARNCPACGAHLAGIGAEWDVVESHQVERVPPVDPAEGYSREYVERALSKLVDRFEGRNRSPEKVLAAVRDVETSLTENGWGVPSLDEDDEDEDPLEAVDEAIEDGDLP